MDFQSFVDTFFAPTCIVAVEKRPDGGCGEIRLAAGNAKYLDMIRMRLENNEFQVSEDAGNAFVPGSLYSKYFPKSLSFEDVCFRAAVQKEEIRTYVHLNNVDIWLDISAMPLTCEEGNICYCTYSATPAHDANKLLDTFHTAQTSNDVLKTCIRLHKAENVMDAMDGVISDIRQICKAECCTVLLLNEAENTFSIVATDFAENSKLKRVTEFECFYEIASSWAGMIGKEGDCIIIRNQEDILHVKQINYPWYLTLVEAGVVSVVLFPLRQGQEILGYIWATNFDTNDTMHIKETLELTTFFISSHIGRYKILKRLQHMSYTDALTGLPNRFASTEYIGRLIRKQEKFAAVSIDLNHFKSINDTLGFDAGNRVLIKVAERWKALSAGRSPETTDYLARLSGDEFLLLIRGYQSSEMLRNAISRYAGALSEHLRVDECDLYATASFGYAEYPADADNTDALISRATAAMKAIKKANSSDHILRFSGDLLRDERILEIENKIRTALEEDTMFFNLQPQYDMNHKLRGFEALARMTDSSGNYISPGEFIPVAEKVGLIDSVDGTVFRKSAMFFGELLRKSGVDMTLSINASVRHMMKNSFLDEIRTLLEVSGIPADKLEIEITESIMIDSADKAKRCIDELKRMGIQIAIDDFGTGYSSLSYLLSFPANLLKIDKSFIDKMNTSESSRQYVAAIISIGHIMGFDVISEGVEVPEQLETLREIGCDYIQGYIWGRPLSAAQTEELVLGLKEDVLP